jgi:hypothetical protein
MYGFRYARGFSELEVFSDVEFAGDKTTLRSTTGVIAVFVDGAVSWTSQLQMTTTFSTTEAKAIAACKGARKLVQ